MRQAMTTQTTPQDVLPAAAPAPAAAAPAPARVTPVVRPTTNGSEKRKQRGVMLRVLTYVVVAHLLAAYLYFMFEVAAKH
jgi:uncharacterized protein DUF6126